MRDVHWGVGGRDSRLKVFKRFQQSKHCDRSISPRPPIPFSETHSSDRSRDPLSNHSTAPQHPWLLHLLNGASSKRSIARGIAPVGRSGLVSGILCREGEKKRTLSRPTVVARSLRERVSCGWRMRWAASIADILDGDDNTIIRQASRRYHYYAPLILARQRVPSDKRKCGCNRFTIRHPFYNSFFISKAQTTPVPK
jgi:hypothetical protein